MSGLFTDPKKQRQFNLLGFVSFPLLTSEKAGELRQSCERLAERHGQSSVPFRSTSGSGDSELISLANSEIDRVVSPVLLEHFQDFSLLGYNFLIKDSGEDSGVSAHQDWTYVDEEHYTSLNIWIALHDVSETDGCLWFVPRSHRIASFLRPAPDYPWPYAKESGFLESLKKSIPLRAGECVCFNNGVVHGSYPNLSGTKRYSAVGTVYPKDAELQHFFQIPGQPEGQLWKHLLDAKTFLTMKRGTPPSEWWDRKEVHTRFPKIGKARLIGRLIGLRLTDFLG